jgi:hypothetical protein
MAYLETVWSVLLGVAVQLPFRNSNVIAAASHNPQAQ